MYNNGKKSSLKFKKTRNCYENSTGTISIQLSDLPSKEGQVVQARSYNWTFLEYVNDVLIFNCYRWSNTTSKHQHEVRSFLRERNIKYVEIDLGGTRPFYALQVGGIVNDMYRELNYLIIDQQVRPKKDHPYAIALLERNFELVQSLAKKNKDLYYLTLKEQKEIEQQVAERYFEEMNQKAQDRVFRSVQKQFVTTNLDNIEV